MELEIRVPMSTRAFFTNAQVPGLKSKLAGIGAKYQNLIASASTLTGVSAELITSVIFIESGGNEKALSPSGAAGLMQVAPKTAPGIVFLAKKARLLTAPLKAALQAALGQRADNILRWHYMDEPGKGNTAVSKQELLNPALNVLLGSLLLAVLISEHNENGVIRLDKVISRYNRGYFYKPKGSTDELMASVPAETKAYILKLVGVNSTLDILAA